MVAVTPCIAGRTGMCGRVNAQGDQRRSACYGLRAHISEGFGDQQRGVTPGSDPAPGNPSHPRGAVCCVRAQVINAMDMVGAQPAAQRGRDQRRECATERGPHHA